jgi:hypothetical protein
MPNREYVVGTEEELIRIYMDAAHELIDLQKQKITGDFEFERRVDRIHSWCSYKIKTRTQELTFRKMQGSENPELKDCM